MFRDNASPSYPTGPAPGPVMHLNRTVHGLRPSATVAINERADAMRQAGQRVFKLGLGQSPFPVPRTVRATLQAHAGQKDYLPVQGLGVLREAVAEHHRRTFGIECSADDVMIAYVDFDGEAALGALSTRSPHAPVDAGFVRQFCRPTAEAVERICDWLDE